jgi:hypothetical protein
MPRQGLEVGFLGFVSQGMWYRKGNAFKGRGGAQSKIIEMPVGIDHFKEANGHVTVASGQERGTFSASNLALEILHVWVCGSCHHHLSKKSPATKTQKNNPEISASHCPYRPYPIGFRGGEGRFNGILPLIPKNP